MANLKRFYFVMGGYVLFLILAIFTIFLVKPDQTLLISILMLCLVIGGILTIIFSQEMSDFVNKSHPLRWRFSKSHFVTMGIIIIIISLIIWIFTLLAP